MLGLGQPTWMYMNGLHKRRDHFTRLMATSLVRHNYAHLTLAQEFLNLNMRHWIGKSLIGIGIIHTIFAAVFIAPKMGDILSEGIFNTINGQPPREAFLWFVMSGFLLMILGWLTDHWEKAEHDVPVFLGWSLLGITIFVVMLSPVSGGWLILIPSLAILTRKRQTRDTEIGS